MLYLLDFVLFRTKGPLETLPVIVIRIEDIQEAYNYNNGCTYICHRVNATQVIEGRKL